MPSPRLTSLARPLVPLALAALASSALAAAATGCSDTDPHFGPPGAISKYTPDLGGSSGTTPTTEGGAPGGATAMELFAIVYDGPNNVGTKTTCGSCHATAASVGNKPELVFYGADVNATYTNFKKPENGFDKANSRFYNVAAGHPGPALKAEQKKAIDDWVAKEAGGGASAPTDAGGGG